MKASRTAIALLFLSSPALADYTECNQYADVHDTERAAFDAEYRNYDTKVLEPLRRQVADLDRELGESAAWEKRLRKLQKQNRGFAGDNVGAEKKQAKAQSKIQSNERLIAEKRTQIEDADAAGNSKRANKLRNEISKLTKKTGKLKAAIAERKVKIANRENKIASNNREIAELKQALARSGSEQLLERRRAIDEKLQNRLEDYALAQRTVDVTASAIELCEAYADLRGE